MAELADYELQQETIRDKFRAIMANVNGISGKLTSLERRNPGSPKVPELKLQLSRQAGAMRRMTEQYQFLVDSAHGF